MRENNAGFNDLIEQPALRSLLPKLENKRVLDLGCGYGDLTRYLRMQGAAYVLGIDISANMLNLARSKTNDDAIEYQQIAFENLVISPSTFDVVVSSVALHYLEDFDKLVKKIYVCLEKSGCFIFSVEHPICTAHPNTLVIKAEEGQDIWPVENYRDEGLFEQTWFVDHVRKYHRTISTYVNTLINAGFSIDQLLEPMPNDEMIQKNPVFAIHKIRPPLLVIKALK